MDSTNDSGIKWGAEIAVDGVRPEWLPADDTQVWYRCLDGYTCTHRAFMISNDLAWWTKVGHGDQIVAIRLPADHPHYQKQAEAPAIDPALVKRMIHLLRTMAEHQGHYQSEIAEDWVEEGCDILKALEPADEDLLEARRVAANSRIVRDEYGSFDDGQMDDHPLVVCALAAIRRGRQLERGEG